MEWLLEVALIGMLAATLFHALRLERALGVLKRDRAALEELVAGFNTSTRQAEHSIDRLRDAADGAGRQLARHVEHAQALRGDLQLLNDRGERLADRLDHLVRAGRAFSPEANGPQRFAAPEPMPAANQEEPMPRLRSQAERDLLKALRMAR